jgi:signal transduction histidine kinase
MKVTPPGTFRTRVLVAMILVTVLTTGLGLFFVERKVAAETEHDLALSFQAELNALHSAQEIREAVLTERCRNLVRRPRIVAALEDGALDLLYLSAKDELRDLMARGNDNPQKNSSTLQARFYRFLNADGSIILTGEPEEVGRLSSDEERQLSLKRLPEQLEIGFLWHPATDSISEVFSLPIVSSETGERISALVVGLNSSNLRPTGKEMRSGILLSSRLQIPGIDPLQNKRLAEEVTQASSAAPRNEGRFDTQVDGAPHRLFFKILNPGSMFPPAYEVCIYPLAELLTRQQTLRFQAAGICLLLLVGGIVTSQFLSIRLSRPVEKLAIDSAENLEQRKRAESALEVTSQELQRAARFSADASHQLKTPVTVLRAGLDELLATENLTDQTREEISALRHQTFRLNHIIEDLLLLSRMDAGRLQLNLGPVSLADIVESWLDDFSTMPDMGLEIETDFGENDLIVGEKRYTIIIVENLLENARKYNRPGGRIKITVQQERNHLSLRVGNNGRTIPLEMQEHIFERFHRGGAGENVPGYGLGLNLARELARLHGGDLRLVQSKDDWTEFEVSFRPAQEQKNQSVEVS